VARWGNTRLGRRLRVRGRVRQAQAFLSRHGGKAILLSHLVGHVRSFVALSAGTARMRYSRFLAYEMVAALLWNSLYAAIGYAVRAEWPRLLLIMERAG